VFPQRLPSTFKNILILARYRHLFVESKDDEAMTWASFMNHGKPSPTLQIMIFSWAIGRISRISIRNRNCKVGCSRIMEKHGCLIKFISSDVLQMSKYTRYKGGPQQENLRAIVCPSIQQVLVQRNHHEEKIERQSFWATWKEYGRTIPVCQNQQSIRMRNSSTLLPKLTGVLERNWRIQIWERAKISWMNLIHHLSGLNRQPRFVLALYPPPTKFRWNFVSSLLTPSVYWNRRTINNMHCLFLARVSDLFSPISTKVSDDLPFKQRSKSGRAWIHPICGDMTFQDSTT
jgi:hypothetical protein